MTISQPKETKITLEKQNATYSTHFENIHLLKFEFVEIETQNQ